MNVCSKKFLIAVVGLVSMVVWGVAEPVPSSHAMDPTPASPVESFERSTDSQEIQGRGILQVAPTLGGVPGRFMPAAGGSWRHTHGDAANTGFANVVTAPGTLPSRKVSGLGSYAPGAGPVIASNGTVYLGNSQGQLRALTPAGDPKWMRDTPGRKIVASPVVGADGSIYVVGTSVARDHRDGRQFLRYFANLYRFDPGGAMLWVRPFPERSQGAGATSAAPNIWRSGDTEVIIVPVLYNQQGAYQLTLVAFSTNGGLLFEQKVTGWAPQVTGSGSWGDAFCAIYPLCFNQQFGLNPTVLAPNTNQLPAGVEPPMPSVGIYTGASGGAPLVVVADNYQNIVGYSFSPTQGFQEIFRKHLTKDWMRMSSPTLMRDGHSVVRGNGSKQAWVLFGGPNVVNWTEVSTALTGAIPTITADGRIVMVDRSRGLTVIGTYPSRTVLNHVPLEAESIAPAAASCSHVFVSTANALVTLDAKATTVVAKFDWRAGGLSSPAIGPSGGVYVLAGDSLHIFPPPPPSRLVGVTGCQDGASRVQSDILENPTINLSPGSSRLPKTRTLSPIMRRGINGEQTSDITPIPSDMTEEPSEAVK
ncbi:MAG: PQQ-like beta-propeller repeat protein [Nitrospira sp.]|nr:PQQ-like beta-propeller repeat protein [Nitrospira sp.]MCW5784328.1 PQQ-like beta-propeller repeat protein [Nitrospirales bacterium]